jgi:hypothetical protein
MPDPTEPIEFDLIRTGIAVEITIDKTDFAPTPSGEIHARIEGHLAPSEDAEPEDPHAGEDGDVSWGALPFIYLVGLLSFRDAGPRGASTIDFAHNDEWHAADMLRHLRFDRGELRFYADYVRGRMMKTEVIVRRDGTFIVDTVNRGELAGEWMHLVAMKKLPTVADMN